MKVVRLAALFNGNSQSFFVNSRNVAQCFSEHSAHIEVLTRLRASFNSSTPSDFAVRFAQVRIRESFDLKNDSMLFDTT